MEWISSPEAWIALATLTALEIVLGVDNIIFISILVGRLPEAQRQRARILGLGLAMGTRILLLLLLTWIMRLQATLFTVVEVGISGRDLILIGGGLFLLAKSHDRDPREPRRRDAEGEAVRHAGFVSMIITDRADRHRVLARLGDHGSGLGRRRRSDDHRDRHRGGRHDVRGASRSVDFVDTHPTVKMLALSFLVLIGVALIAEGIDLHIPKGYIYFAMAFSVLVEMLNIRIRGGRKPVQLRKKDPWLTQAVR